LTQRARIEDMNKIFLLFLCLLFLQTAFSQSNKYLVLKHRDKQKEVVIAQGEFVVVKTFKGEKVRGQMEVLSETLIRVKHKVVPLTNVERIGKRDAWTMRIASLIVSTGMNITLFGLSDNLRHGWDTPSENYKAGIPLLAAGIPMLVLTYKRTSRHWTYEGTMGNW
jgi:hypothetical protein